MSFWLRNGLIGFAILTGMWGLIAIVFDSAIEAATGTIDTISGQTQQFSIANPVVPAAVGLVTGGLVIHFFKVRDWSWFDPRQPLRDWVIGAVAGMILVAYTWTQRG